MTTFPDPSQASATQPPSMVPVAFMARVSHKDSQDPTLSLPRQLERARAALPPECVIIAHFWDVESGRLELDQRGSSDAHAAFDIQIPRDGGIQDLLEEAREPRRRFVAVVCESVSRVARTTYASTKIEHDLEQAGVPILTHEEGVSRELVASLGTPTSRPKKAGTILNRRMHQAIAEWYVLNMLEQSWDGTVQHTYQGWNIGKPPYGYQAKRVPHPVPAKRAEGRTKHRLEPDPVRGPVVTHIFKLRANERVGYDEIAVSLNDDPERFPPPQPPNPARAVGRWTWSSVREVLTNPKYTGYMVWNRRATKKGGKCNPPSEWVWSPQAVHEPLVTRQLFEAAADVAESKGRSRKVDATAGRRHSYQLRSYVSHELCGRRMSGKRERNYLYYTCDRKAGRDQGKHWYEAHPPSARVPADVLEDAVQEFFTMRILGSDRKQFLAESLAKLDGDRERRERDERERSLERQIADLRRRQDRLLDELEHALDEAMGEEGQRTFRQRLHERFARASKELSERQRELDELQAAEVSEPGGDCTLLDSLPVIAGSLEACPDPLMRSLYDSFKLQIIYSHERHEATIKVTITDATAASLPLTSTSTAPPAQHGVARVFTGLQGAPNGIRTRVTALKGRRPRPLDDGGTATRRESA